MSADVEVDVWVRGTQFARTHRIGALPAAHRWIDEDVRRLLSEMLLALERERNPGGEVPPVTLRGFSWIVSPYEPGGVVLHLEMQTGTASAGPFAIPEADLTGMIARIMSAPESDPRVH
ncbi:MAG: hypothetical protein ACT4QD_11050 [Acidobacteriota bacterium]